MPFHYGLGAALAGSGGGPGMGSPLTRMLLRELGPGVRGALDGSPLMDATQKVGTKSPPDKTAVAPPASIQDRLLAMLRDPAFMQSLGALMPQAPAQMPPMPPTAFPIFGQFPPISGGLFG